MQVVTTLIDVSELPEKLMVDSNYDAVIVAARVADDFEFIPDYLMREIADYFSGEEVELSDVEFVKGAGTEVRLFEVIERVFTQDSISNFFCETGLHSFVAYFRRFDTYLIGLTMEMTIILSPKITGFIAQKGGVEMFAAKALERFSESDSALNRGAHKQLLELSIRRDKFQ